MAAGGTVGVNATPSPPLIRVTSGIARSPRHRVTKSPAGLPAEHVEAAVKSDGDPDPRAAGVLAVEASVA